MKIRIAVAGLVMAAGLLFGVAAWADDYEPVDASAYAQRGSYSDRSAYSYIRTMTGEATVNSRWNGTVEARRNMPISVGDEISLAQGGRVEIGMADGNILFLGGGTRVAFEALSSQQGEQDQASGIRLVEGDLAISGLGAREAEIPRVDTDDATVYLARGSHARINSDPRRGTVVVARAGSIEVRTRIGTYTVRAGQYLMARGDEEPEIGRGAFSRDRFDIWVAERLEAVQDVQSASVRYVGDQYANDVVALDGNGNWDYDANYGGNVWVPRVDADWSPYSNGSWYYTTAGLTWWSNDPWGWYPFHYGNWFYARNRWCWAPGYTYSPAWVYWGYSGGYVGWCPIGYYSGFSPWWDTYYRSWGYQPRTSLYFAINGTFDCRRVDWRGWNFTGAGSFGTVTRAGVNVIPGSRIVDRLGSQVAVSSRPIVVNPRDGGGVRSAIQTYVREAPRTIERTAGTGSDRLAPVLSRERTLPADTVAALRERAVVAERGRLAGPAAGELAPRGALVERSRTVPSGGLAGRETLGGDRQVRERAPVISGDHSTARIAPRAADDSWRGRAIERPSVAPPAVRSDSWRSRSEVPPAQRVIEGAVPNHRVPEARTETWRGREFHNEVAPRVERAPEARTETWRGREFHNEPAPRVERAPEARTETWRGRDFRPEMSPRIERGPVERGPVERGPVFTPPSARIERAPNFERRERIERPPYVAPQPRVEPRIERPYTPPQPPAHIERAPYSPPAHVERAPAPAPAPRAEVHREAPQHSSPPQRSAPAPHQERGRPN